MRIAQILKKQSANNVYNRFPFLITAADDTSS